MTEKEWDKRRQFWKEFAIWENSQKPIRKNKSNIRLIGEVVDFYLKKYSKTKGRLLSQKDYGKGVTQLHKNFSLWRKK